MKRVLLVGQRDSVFSVLTRHPAVTVIGCVAIEGSFLHRRALTYAIETVSVTKQQKDAAVAAIQAMDFDVLVSVGWPWLLPIATLRQDKPDAKFINVHPSCLPRLRGAHPLNGALLLDESRVGATVHWMDGSFDTGNIIAQVCIERTPDLDLGLLYLISRMLEAEAMAQALELLAATDFSFAGYAQRGQPSYYTRRLADMQCRAAETSTAELVRRVRAFGTQTQLCQVQTGEGVVTALDAEPIVNLFLLERYANAPAGTVIAEYDNRLLIRTIDGIVKLSEVRWVERSHSSSTAPQ
ncbi:MAG: formyltransferase family protein [Bacteroidota bacterium]|nr:hypothetical protein [Candidatus Kapabacteria bacterium]MCS7303147.1 hypothetical protein [Candidatus Kapabacteria bacterium]MCX7937192.1 formyltransferase family protein [Chlorobiota bacterium]MDW8075723.1 formyltransferase family protein [Bacteroidota bacterium]MDW8272055.1 formyltransferase family protein [Bacteroidota bacterium]